MYKIAVILLGISAIFHVAEERVKSNSFISDCEKIKMFFGLNSLGACAVKMGYSKSAATTWRRKKALSKQALARFNLIREGSDACVGKNEQGLSEGVGRYHAPNKRIYTIRYYNNVLASAGYGATNSDITNNVMRVTEDFFRSMGIAPGNLDAIKIIGDSMWPDLEDGDLVFVERGRSFKNGDTVIINVNGDLYVKLIKKDPFKQSIRLVSKNRDYADIVLDKTRLDNVEVIGVVKAKGNIKMKLY